MKSGAVFIKQTSGKATTSIQPGGQAPKNLVSEYTNKPMFKQKSMPVDSKRNNDYDQNKFKLINRVSDLVNSKFIRSQP